MKKIVCLVDHSSSFDAIARYAAQLAHDTSSKVVLASLQHHIPAKVMAVVDEEDNYSYGSSRLAETCDQVRGIWKVPCEYHGFEEDEMETRALLASNDVWLIVTGMESSTKTLDKLFFAPQFKLLRDIHVPVLFVPDRFQYQKINRMLYAFDYEHNSKPPVGQLQKLAELMEADVRILSVIQKSYSTEEEEKIDRKDAEILSQWKSKRELTFDFIYYANVTRCLDHYMDLWHADHLVIISLKHQSFTERLFHHSILQEMNVCSDYPIMIIRN